MTSPPLPSRRPSVAILGAGGVGGLIGALLAHSGLPTTMIVTETTAATLRRDGLHTTGTPFGDVRADVRVASDLVEPVDLCLVATKQNSLPDALERLPTDQVGDALVLPLLNGVEHVSTLSDRYPAVVPGVIRVAATRTAPGRIHQASPFVEVDVARGTVSEHRLDVLTTALTDAGITTTVRGDAAAMLWGKLALLAPLALVTTAHGASIGTARTLHRTELATLVQEVAAVSRAVAGVDLSDRAPDFYDGFAPDARTSMEVDAAAGRPLELDAIGGAVIRAADAQGLDVPTLRTLVTRLR